MVIGNVRQGDNTTTRLHNTSRLAAAPLGNMSRCLSPTSSPTMVIGDLRDGAASPPGSPSSPLTDDTYDNTIDEDPDSASECGSKKTAGRRKIGMKLIDHKQKRNATFHKRKSGLMKKGFELSKLTGAEVFVMAVWDKAVFSYGTKKLERILTAPTGKDLVRYCMREPISAKDADDEPQEWSRCHIKQDATLSLDDSVTMPLGNPDLQGTLGTLNCWDQQFPGIENPTHLADILQAQWKQPQAMHAMATSPFPIRTASPLLGRGCQMPGAFGMPYYGNRPAGSSLGLNPMMSQQQPPPQQQHLLAGEPNMGMPAMMDGYPHGGHRVNGGAFMAQGIGGRMPAPAHRTTFHDQQPAFYDCAMQPPRGVLTKTDLAAFDGSDLAHGGALAHASLPSQHQGRQFSAASIDVDQSSIAAAAASVLSSVNDDALSCSTAASHMDEPPHFLTLDDFP